MVTLRRQCTTLTWVTDSIHQLRQCYKGLSKVCGVQRLYVETAAPGLNETSHHSDTTISVSC